MPNLTNLKTNVQNVIRTNANNEITGAIVQTAFLNTITEIASGSLFAGIATPSTNPGNQDGNHFYIAYQKGTYSSFNTYQHNGVGFVIFNNKSGSWVANHINFITIDPFSLSNNQLFIWNSHDGILKPFLLRILSSPPTTPSADGLYLVEGYGVYVVENNVVTLIASSVGNSSSDPIHEIFVVNARRGGMNINTFSTPAQIEIGTGGISILDGQYTWLAIQSGNIPFETLSGNPETGFYFIIVGKDSVTNLYVMKCWSLSKWGSSSSNTLLEQVVIGVFRYEQNTATIPYTMQVEGLSIKCNDIRINGYYIGGGEEDGSTPTNPNLFNPLLATSGEINATTGALIQPAITNRKVSGIMTGVVPGQRYKILGIASHLVYDIGIRFLDSSNTPLKPLDWIDGQSYPYFQLSAGVYMNGFWSPATAVAAQFDFVLGISPNEQDLNDIEFVRHVY